MNPRRLYRCRDNRQIAGVAAGIAEYFELDPTVVRVAWILSALFGGVTIVAYIILAFVMPLEPIEIVAGAVPATDGEGAGESAGEDAGHAGREAAGVAGPTGYAASAARSGHASHVASASAHNHRSRNGQPGRAGLIFGVLLVTFGLISLIGPLVPGWMTGAFTGPALVLALGIALVVSSTRRTAPGR
ncbi:MAG: PspC domain-containing protein [Chloroflexota bacterium]